MVRSQREFGIHLPN